MHAQVICSEVSPRMVPWYGLLPGREEIPSVRDRVGSKASPICHGANGMIDMASMLNTTHLMLCEAAGTAVPSFSSTLLEGGVSPEEEDVIMWASSQVYLGTFHFQ